MDIQLRPATPDDAHHLITLDQWAFAFPLHEVDFTTALQVVEWDRTRLACLDDGRPVGLSTTFSLRMPVPGDRVDCAGLTWVAVHPDARRRGVLRAMMQRHLADARERGEPISALHAAEQPIYGRFGYGLAAHHLQFTLPRGAELRAVAGSEEVEVGFTVVAPDDPANRPNGSAATGGRAGDGSIERLAERLAECRSLAAANRPGMVDRPTPAHARQAVEDQLYQRRNAETLRVLLAEGAPGEPLRGYALFRRTMAWADDRPNGTVVVREMIARDPAAARAIWSRLVDLDLTSTITTDPRPLDDPLIHLLTDYRAASPRLTDGIWIRLVDLPAALAARRYQRNVDVVLGVTDDLIEDNAGRWRLRGGPDGPGECTRTSAEPDLLIDIRELGAAYLGSMSLVALADAGLVREVRPGSLALTARAFGWPVAAACGWQF